MAGFTGESEVIADREEIWGKYSIEGGYRQDIVLDDRDDQMVIFGRVVNRTWEGVPGAVLGLCAYMGKGEEIPVAFTYSDRDGNYMFSFKKPAAPVEKYIVRVGSATGRY
ncbi:MAG: hypothetical protein JL50_07660 [Peptococcaceae bacterium BICA1-7]|nr:MAG: hypothetical protein JL50_07660 [Peptococcaceae bacterium BICA1-7]HBV97883.1 hypothetical protein [Desulfotomaculum sp.]